MKKIIVIACPPPLMAVVKALSKDINILVIDKDELPEDIVEHVHPDRFPKLIVNPSISAAEKIPTRNVRPEFRNKVSDRYPKSNKRDRSPFSKRR